MTSPVAGLPKFTDTSPNTPWLHFDSWGAKLDPIVVPNFSTTTARNTAYAAMVTAGGTMRAGILCSVNGLIYRSTGTSTSAWDLLVPASPRIPARTVTGLGGGLAIGAGGSAETGFTSGVAALPSFALTQSSTVKFDAQFRAGVPGGTAQCTVKINGATVGNVAISRADGTVGVTGAVALAAGTHSVALRVDAVAGATAWVDGIITMVIGTSE